MKPPAVPTRRQSRVVHTRFLAEADPALQSEPVPARRHPLPAALTERPFTLELARSLGVERPRGVGVRRIAPRVHSVVEPSFRERVAAQLATLPADALVDGVTALRLHGIDLGPDLPLRFCSPRGVQVRRLGVRVRRLSGSTPPSQDRLLTPEAAFAAAAYDLGLVELVAAGDWLVRVNKATPAGLRDHVEGLRGRHSRTVRRAAELVRERVDSPPESRLRLCLVLAGLPEPHCNVELDDGRFFLAQPDLTYRRERLVLEYEGDHHRTDRAQWLKDVRRERELRRAGFELLRVTTDTLRRPRALVDDVHSLLVVGGYDGPPPEFSPVWCACFESWAASGSSGRLSSPVKLSSAPTQRTVR